LTRYRLDSWLERDTEALPIGKWESGCLRAVLGFDYTSRRFDSIAEAQAWLDERVADAGYDGIFLPPIYLVAEQDA
jgi:hypothetical protein